MNSRITYTYDDRGNRLTDEEISRMECCLHALHTPTMAAVTS